MKIYRKKIGPIAEEIINTLVRDEDIEIRGSLLNAVVKDISNFIEEYAKQEQAVSDEAKAKMEEEGLSVEHLIKVKNIIAQQRGVKLGDDALEYLAEKIIKYLLTEDAIEEVYSDDPSMKKKIYDIFRKHTFVEDDIDKEVRARLKNIPENSPIFKIEYEKVLREIKRKRGLI